MSQAVAELEADAKRACAEASALLRVARYIADGADACLQAMCKKCSSRDHACACRRIAGHTHRTGPAVFVATPCACPQVETISELCLWGRCAIPGG